MTVLSWKVVVDDDQKIFRENHAQQWSYGLSHRWLILNSHQIQLLCICFYDEETHLVHHFNLQGSASSPPQLLAKRLVRDGIKEPKKTTRFNLLSLLHIYPWKCIVNYRVRHSVEWIHVIIGVHCTICLSRVDNVVWMSIVSTITPQYRPSEQAISDEYTSVFSLVT